jgi:hypothetical protein
MARKKIYVIAATFQGRYIIRFVVCSRVTESRDIVFAWEEIRTQTEKILSDNADNEAETPPQKKKKMALPKTCPLLETEKRRVIMNPKYFL